MGITLSPKEERMMLYHGPAFSPYFEDMASMSVRQLNNNSTLGYGFLCGPESCIIPLICIIPYIYIYTYIYKCNYIS